MIESNRHIVSAVVTLGVLLALSPGVEAGPPLICHPFDTGGATASLPWGKGQDWNTPDGSYDVRRLTTDTMRLLSADAPVLARMETLRRATIYASGDRSAAAELLTAVMGRALTAAAEGSRDPLAWFDAGYLIEAYRQGTVIHRRDMVTWAARSGWVPARETQGLDGYRLVQKAIELAGPSPEMEFAASLMKEGPASAEHRRRAVAGARSGSLLAKNLGR